MEDLNEVCERPWNTSYLQSVYTEDSYKQSVEVLVVFKAISLYMILFLNNRKYIILSLERIYKSGASESVLDYILLMNIN